MEKFYKDYMNDFLFSVEKILPQDFIVDKRIFILNIKKFLKRELEKIIAPSVCWLLWSGRENLIGRNSIERFNNFVKKYQKFFFDIYPEIDLILIKFLEKEFHFLNVIFQKIIKNINILNKNFNLKNKKVKRIIFTNNADRHFNGFRTFFIDFGEKRIKVKPFSFSFNISLIELFSKIDRKITTNLPKYYFIDGWFFTDFIRYDKKSDKENAKKFYFEIGKLMALAYCFNGVDFHMENIIVHKNKPIILDSEGFITNFSIFRTNLKNNLYATGFLERKTKEPPTSAILGGNRKLISLVDPEILKRNTDKMHIIYRKYSNYKLHNRIFIEDKMVMPRTFKNEIIKGFIDFYSKIVENKQNIISDLEKIKNISSRVILRKTSFYSILIQHITQPINFPLEKFILKIKRTLEQNSFRFHKVKGEKLKKLIDFELKSIFDLEVPIFWQKMENKDVYFPEGMIKDFFKKSAKEILIEKIKSISKKDLNRKIRIIEKVL